MNFEFLESSVSIYELVCAARYTRGGDVPKLIESKYTYFEATFEVVKHQFDFSTMQISPQQSFTEANDNQCRKKNNKSNQPFLLLLLLLFFIFLLQVFWSFEEKCYLYAHIIIYGTHRNDIKTNISEKWLRVHIDRQTKKKRVSKIISTDKQKKKSQQNNFLLCK